MEDRGFNTPFFSSGNITKQEQKEDQQPLQAAKISDFVWSVVDPFSSGYQDRLQEMNESERKAAQQLLHNLAINLASQQSLDQHAALSEQMHTLWDSSQEGKHKGNSTKS